MWVSNMQGEATNWLDRRASSFFDFRGRSLNEHLFHGEKWDQAVKRDKTGELTSHRFDFRIERAAFKTSYLQTLQICHAPRPFLPLLLTIPTTDSGRPTGHFLLSECRPHFTSLKDLMSAKYLRQSRSLTASFNISEARSSKPGLVVERLVAITATVEETPFYVFRNLCAHQESRQAFSTGFETKNPLPSCRSFLGQGLQQATKPHSTTLD
jgi:hypothetical protein